MAGLARASEVAVTSDGGGVCEALVERLRARGVNARATEADLGQSQVVIFLGGLREVPDDDAALAVSREAFQVAQAFAARAGEHGGVFVTVQDTGGDFGLGGSERAILGALSGLAKTAALEWPKASVKAIDLERGQRDAAELADAIVQELYAGGPQIEVGLRADGRRLTLESLLQPIEDKRPPRLSERSVIVCSGGARGVTAATLVEVARRSHSRMVLLGRTALSEEPAACKGVEGDAALKHALLAAAKHEGRPVKPAELGAEVRHILAVREIRTTLAALRDAGSEARYSAADVKDPESVAAALAEAREQWGPITAVVHGAGVVADKLIVDKTTEQFERVLSTKVEGLRALLAATAADPVDTIVLFSSVAARTGNVGQCDYAMANEILNKVAAREARRRGEGCLVKSLGWGPWEGGMVTPALRRYFEQQGVPLIPLATGAEMMCDELCASGEDIEIVLGGRPRRASLAGEEERSTHCDVFVDASTHPYLVDHSIQDVPVLPVVLVLEWFARAAQAMSPGLVLKSCRDLRVFRGVRLERFRNGGDWLSLSCREIGERCFELELRHPDDPRIRHYAGVVELTDPQELAPQAARVPELDLRPLEVPIYGDALFHGPAFQVIRDVAGVCGSGISGQLDGTAEQRWVGGPWSTDPAALDGGLQLAVLWAQHRLGGNGLPTGLGAYHAFTPLPIAGPMRCDVSAKVEGPSRAVSEITFSDQQGRLVARLEGVVTHQRP